MYWAHGGKGSNILRSSNNFFKARSRNFQGYSDMFQGIYTGVRFLIMIFWWNQHHLKSGLTCRPSGVVSSNSSFSLNLRTIVFSTVEVFVVQWSSSWTSHRIYITWGTSAKKKRENVGIFPMSGTPPPSPLFGNPMFVRKKKLWFILHFRTLGTFLVFTKMFTYGWYYGL